MTEYTKGMIMNIMDLVANLVRPREFKCETRTISKVPKGKILIRNKACGVCQGTEIWPWKGQDCDTGENIKFPYLMGHQNTGIVEIVGEGVEGIKVGERVFGGGGYRRFSLADPFSCIKIPNEVSYETATQIIEIGGMLKDIGSAEIKSDDKVVIIGAGPMGILALQRVNLDYPDQIIVTDLLKERLQYAKRFGADYVIDASEQNQIEEVIELTQGGATVVIEATVSIGCMKIAVEMLRKEGRLVVFGTHPEPINLKPAFFKEKSCRVLFTFPQGKEEWHYYSVKAMKLIDRGIIRVEPLITHRVRIEEIQQAFETLERDPKSIMKMMIIP